ncbi:MAG TPA: divalent cation tolerance protein CutA [Nitrospiria bacterium]
MVVKTRRTLFDRLGARVRTLHSYTVPEIIALSIQRGSKDYLQWVRKSTR